MPVIPISKTASPTPDNIKLLNAALTSLIAGHAQSIEPWTFYEEVDNFLGPWGNNGYPIGYGKYYCVAFNSNEKLRANPQTADWIRRTTIVLQEALRDFIMMRFKAGTLPQLTEKEFRDYAFASHPKAYDSGGLAMVALVATELLPVIASIPGKEFDPRSVNFGPTVTQVLKTIGLIAPEAVGNSLAAMALPAHTGILSRAADMDRNRFLREQELGRSLSQLLRSIQLGQLDSFVLLTQVTDRLNATEFPDQGFAQLARQIIQVADGRKHYIANVYRGLIKLHPELRAELDTSQPGWSKW